MDLTGITGIGVDEIYWQKGKFLTLVYQINEGMKRLLFVSEAREEKSLRKFFLWLGKERSDLIQFVCSHTWKLPGSHRGNFAIHVRHAFENIKRKLPFDLIAVNTDSGSEFINAEVLEFMNPNTAVRFAA